MPRIHPTCDQATKRPVPELHATCVRALCFAQLLFVLMMTLPSLSCAADSRPSTERYTLTVDNTGNAQTGKRRVLLGYQNTDWMQAGHRLIAQIGTTDDPGNSRHASVNYRIPDAIQKMSLDILGSVSETNTLSVDEFGTTEFNGIGTRVGLRLNQTLQANDGYRHRLRYALDLKDFDNTCTGAKPGTCGTVSNRPLSLVYNGNQFEGEWPFTVVASLIHNLPGGPHDSEEEFAASRQGAQRQWQTAKLLLSMTHAFQNGMQARLQFNGQYSADRLVVSEQFFVGGSNSVRGYKERSLSGDRGYTVNMELYSRNVGRDLTDRLDLRGLVFLDHGATGFTDATVSEQTRSLTGAGVGLRGAWAHRIVLRLDIGRAMDSVQSSRSADRQRQPGDLFGHFSISLQY